jgi:hypothetical protein
MIRKKAAFERRLFIGHRRVGYVTWKNVLGSAFGRCFCIPFEKGLAAAVQFRIDRDTSQISADAGQQLRNRVWINPWTVTQYPYTWITPD